VPFYIRAGKFLPVTCAEIIVRFHQPPTMYSELNLRANYFRFRISPEVTLAFGMNVIAQRRLERLPLSAVAIMAVSGGTLPLGHAP
jgi:glucose-6-phosphate 1-dehydrogenase